MNYGIFRSFKGLSVMLSPEVRSIQIMGQLFYPSGIFPGFPGYYFPWLCSLLRLIRSDSWRLVYLFWPWLFIPWRSITNRLVFQTTFICFPFEANKNAFQKNNHSFKMDRPNQFSLPADPIFDFLPGLSKNIYFSLYHCNFLVADHKKLVTGTIRTPILFAYTIHNGIYDSCCFCLGGTFWHWGLCFSEH